MFVHKRKWKRTASHLDKTFDTLGMSFYCFPSLIKKTDRRFFGNYCENNMITLVPLPDLNIFYISIKY